MEDILNKNVLVVFKEDGTTQRIFGRLIENTNNFITIDSEKNLIVLSKRDIIKLKVKKGEVDGGYY